MDLRRSRKLLVLCLFFGLAGAILLVTAGDRISGFRLVLGSIGILVAIPLAIRGLRPFRFRILPEGLDVRHRGINRTIPWAEVESVVLEQPTTDQGPAPARLLLVAAPGSELAARTDAKHPVDGRSARVLLDTQDVKDAPDAIAEAIALMSGGRFADLRDLEPAAADRSAADFTVVLRGYEIPEVDRLLRTAQEAIDGDREQRSAAHARLANPNLAVALRGYDRGQVDAHLQRLATELAG
jgi:DivIVA domain-containing protein